MNFFKRLFGTDDGETEERSGPPGHAVLVHLKLSDDQTGDPGEREDINRLETRLGAAVQSRSVGEFDGNEFGGGECVLYMYGPDADALFTVVKPLLIGSALSKGAYAIKRYGGPGADEARVDM